MTGSLKIVEHCVKKEAGVKWRSTQYEDGQKSTEAGGGTDDPLFKSLE